MAEAAARAGVFFLFFIIGSIVIRHCGTKIHGDKKDAVYANSTYVVVALLDNTVRIRHRKRTTMETPFVRVGCGAGLLSCCFWSSFVRTKTSGGPLVVS
jgi:hypothetical protein